MALVCREYFLRITYKNKYVKYIKETYCSKNKHIKRHECVSMPFKIAAFTTARATRREKLLKEGLFFPGV